MPSGFRAIMLIEIADQQTVSRLGRRRIQSAARFALRSESVAHADLSVALVDDRAIHELNRRYLQHDCPTDVITFPLSGAGEPLVAEIVVSVETAAREARRRRCTCEDEVLLYLIHGILHLCGYDDHAESDSRRMRRRQRELLRSFQQSGATGRRDRAGRGRRVGEQA